MENIEEEIGRREELALGVFQGKEVLCFYDLPPGVGRKTMDKLVKLGLVREAEDTGPYTKGRCWSLVH